MIPEPSINLPCVVTRVIDGDTVEVEVRVPMVVRIRDCWAPENNTLAGDESTRNMERVTNARGTVVCPLDGVDNLADVFSFSRVLGDVWLDGEDESIGQMQVREGHATFAKPKG